MNHHTLSGLFRRKDSWIKNYLARDKRGHIMTPGYKNQKAYEVVCSSRTRLDIPVL